jgi:hypothetical protein
MGNAVRIGETLEMSGRVFNIKINGEIKDDAANNGETTMTKGGEGGIKQGIPALDGFSARLGGGLAVRGSVGRRRGARRGGGSSPRRAER